MTNQVKNYLCEEAVEDGSSGGWRMEAEEGVALAQRRYRNGMRREGIGEPVARERRVGRGARSWEARATK